MHYLISSVRTTTPGMFPFHNDLVALPSIRKNYHGIPFQNVLPTANITQNSLIILTPPHLSNDFCLDVFISVHP